MYSLSDMHESAYTHTLSLSLSLSNYLSIYLSISPFTFTNLYGLSHMNKFETSLSIEYIETFTRADTYQHILSLSLSHIHTYIYTHPFQLGFLLFGFFI